MSQTKIITKEYILKAGFLIIKEEGDNKLNARNLAKKLSCSTQPIYDSFKNMNVFHEELVNYVRKFYYGFVSENHNNEKSIYMKYIKNYIFFAKEFPNLFKFIFMENPYKETVEEQKFASIIIKKISEAGGYSEDTAFKFFMQSFVFAHGIAVQIVSNYLDWQIDKIYLLLEENFESLKLYYRGK